MNHMNGKYTPQDFHESKVVTECPHNDSDVDQNNCTHPNISKDHLTGEGYGSCDPATCPRIKEVEAELGTV